MAGLALGHWLGIAGLAPPDFNRDMYCDETDDIDTSFIILEITAADHESAAALSSTSNEDFLVHPPKRIKRHKREGTPAVERENLKAVLRTSHLPYDSTRGFVFGREDDATDLVIGTIKQGVSRLHFSIRYNWEAESLLLENLSGNGTGWTNPDNGVREIVRTSRVLLGSKQYRVSAGVIDLILQIPLRDEHQQARHNIEVRRLRSEAEKATPTLDGFKIHISGKVTPMVVGVRRKYVLGSVVGHGLSAIVRQAFDHETGDRFAAKEYTCDSKSIFKSMIREIGLLQKIQHSHIVEYIDMFHDPDPVVIMEFARSSLDRCVIRSTDECVTLLLHVSAGLEYLHRLHIIHRDIKPANILLTGPEFWKLADFGLSKELKAELTGTYCGTPLYVAPENDGLPHSLYTKAVDLWSLGVVGVEYSCGFGPAIKAPEKEWCAAVRERAKASELSASLTKMLDLSPQRRLSARALKVDLETRYRSAPSEQLLRISSVPTVGDKSSETHDALSPVEGGTSKPPSQEVPLESAVVDTTDFIGRLPTIHDVEWQSARTRPLLSSVASISRETEAGREQAKT